ncbi:MAG: putative transcriptional regulator of viral defense system [Limisphaerales bacterium]|jgi:predicted transcriptional regulator of viral defense system
MPDLLNSEEFVIFTTREYANRSAVSMSAATKRLARLAEKERLTKVTKGVWANVAHPYFHPLSCVPYVLGEEQGYVSFLTALHLRGVMSQIPKTIQIATTGRGRVLESPVGRFEFFQIKPELMRDGAEWSESRLSYLIATAEKALVDTLYLSTRKSRRFARLPELDLAHSEFRQREFKRLLKQLPIPLRVLSAIESKWCAIAP